MKNFDIYGNLLLKKLSYGRLRKGELAEYAIRTITIVEKHITENSPIKPLFDALIAKQSEIDMLALRYGVDHLRFEIEEARAILNLNISTLKLKVRLLSRLNGDDHFSLITSTIDSYLRRLYACNNKEFVQRIQGFMNAIKSNQELRDDFTEHNLMEMVEGIQLAHTNLQDVINKRIKILSERPKIPTSFLIGSVTNSIDNLFKTIEVVHLINPELDYLLLADELNQLTEMFKLTISLRDAKNKRKEEGEMVVDASELDADTTGIDTVSEDEKVAEMQAKSSSSLNVHKPCQMDIHSSNEAVIMEGVGEPKPAASLVEGYAQTVALEVDT